MKDRLRHRESSQETRPAAHSGTDDRLRLELTVITSAVIIAALAVTTILWAATGDLDIRTVFGNIALTAVLGGISLLAAKGHSRPALDLLVLLLIILITPPVALYTVGSSTAAAFVLPILLAAAGRGARAGLATAAIAGSIVWFWAWGETAGWYTPWVERDISHLTFDAPALTIIFLLTAVIAGLWSRHVSHLPKAPKGNIDL